jgi:hypothetical protein
MSYRTTREQAISAVTGRHGHLPKPLQAHDPAQDGTRRHGRKGTEKPKVGGSRPPLTTHQLREQAFAPEQAAEVMPALTRSSGFCGSILSVSPVGSDPLLVDISAGPSITVGVGPSIGLSVAPSIGVSVAPSIGVRTDSPVGPSLDIPDQPRRNPAFLLVASDRFVTRLKIISSRNSPVRRPGVRRDQFARVDVRICGRV